MYEWVSITGIISWEKTVDDKTYENVNQSKIEKQKFNAWEKKLRVAFYAFVFLRFFVVYGYILVVTTIETAKYEF